MRHVFVDTLITFESFDPSSSSTILSVCSTIAHLHHLVKTCHQIQSPRYQIKGPRSNRAIERPGGCTLHHSNFSTHQSP